MKKHVPILLGAILFLGFFVALEPLLTYPIWGSDTGEYYYLTQYLVFHGSLLQDPTHLNGYSGWGFGYPDFPGLFLLSGAVAEATSLSSFTSLEFVVPIIGALSTLPLFLLFRRLYPSDGVALLAAGLAAVVFPRTFILSHPAPDTLGDFLAVGALWIFVEWRRDMRWLLPLSILSFSLIASHHLSSYFFFLSATGMVTGLELVTPRRWSLRFPLREYLFLGGFTALLFAYWTFYATAFTSLLAEGGFDIGLTAGKPAFFLGLFTLSLLGLLAFLVHLRRTRLRAGRSLLHLHRPTVRKLYRDFAILGGGIFGCLSILLYVPIPGTGERAVPLDLIWFAPFLVLVPLSSGGIFTSSTSRLGPAPYAWLVVFFLSVAFATVTKSEAIPVDRHVEYVALALSLMTATGIGGLLSRLGDSSSRRTVLVGGLIILIGINAVVAYPPPQLTLGFQEGFTYQDLAIVSWAAASLPHPQSGNGSTLASDHRLSDLYFGLSGSPATWSTTCHLFLGNSSECPPYSGTVTQGALHELHFSLAPHTYRAVDAVAVDSTMVSSGVALDPAQPALPLNESAFSIVQQQYFVLLYENGAKSDAAWLWWVTS